MAAVIAFDQARPGPPSLGSPGVARKDLWLNRLVTCRAAVLASSYAWKLLAAPRGSAATLAMPTAQSTSFTPDVPGSYRIQLSINGGGLGNEQIRIAAVTFDTNGVITNRGWRLPAYNERLGEDNSDGNLLGWWDAVDFILTDIGNTLADGIETKVPFTFASLPLTILQAVHAGDNLDRAYVVITTPFNGSSPRIKLGTSANASLLLDVDATQVGQFETGLYTEISVDDLFLLTLSLAGSTAGKGLLVYKMRR